MIITATLLLNVIITPKTIPLADYASFFTQTASVYTGIVGVVIGYYFGRSQERLQAADKTSSQSQEQPSSSGTEPTQPAAPSVAGEDHGGKIS